MTPFLVRSEMNRREADNQSSTASALDVRCTHIPFPLSALRRFFKDASLADRALKLRPRCLGDTQTSPSNAAAIVYFK